MSLSPSRKRFQDALSHRQPDRVPVDFGAHGCSQMHATCVAALRDYYGLEKRLVKVADIFSMTGEIEDDLKDAMGIDIVNLRSFNATFCERSGYADDWKQWRVHDRYDVLVPKSFNVTDDGKGGYFAYAHGDITGTPSGHMPKDGFYFDVIIRQLPYDEDNPSIEDNLEEYGPISDAELDFIAKDAKRAASSGRGVMAAPGATGLGDIAWLPGPNLREPKGIRNIEDWYMSPALRPDFMIELFDRQADIAIANLEKYTRAVGDTADAAMVCGTDFGTQRGPFISEGDFRKIYLPAYRRINDWIHSHTNWKTFKHCCGGIVPLLPAFIDAGFDGINPVQCSAAGMEPRFLKREFGKDLVFWGGGVDTQRVLPFGTPAEVRAQALERCEIFSPGGGFIFNAIHCVQCNTPVENIAAMVAAVKEFNGV